MDKLKDELQHALDKWARDASKSLLNTLWPLIEERTRVSKKGEEEPKVVPKSRLSRLRKGTVDDSADSGEETYKPIPLKSTVKQAEKPDNPPPLTDDKKGEGVQPLKAEADVVHETVPVAIPMEIEEEKQPTPEPIKAEPKVEEEVKAESPEASESESIASDIKNDLFGSDEDEEAEDGEKPTFVGLRRSEENLNFLLGSLAKHQDEEHVLSEVLDGLEEMFKSNFDQACMKMLVNTEAPRKLHSIEVDNKELRRRVRLLRKHWVESCGRLANPDKVEDWQRLEKRLQSSVAKRNDQEILAALRRIGDSFPDRLTRELRAEMKPLIKAVKEAAKQTKHSEVQLKVKNLVSRYKEKLASTEEESKEEQINRSREQMDKKLSQLAKTSKIQAEMEDRQKRGTKTTDVGPIKKRKH
mmetsp:Transcript_1624/g.3508  ORF Transcript_1624/g.3508 Transcript_1624/m.3508 type:complete len:413 (-) Transcript_1624:189-1427(-)